MSSLNEFLAGTDPQNRADTLKLIGIQPMGGHLKISFTAAAGHLYRVERNHDLAPNSWALLQDEVVGTNGVATVIHTNATRLTTQFYRVLVRP